jgi:predicted GIY-YIG superfamily endonuclease
MEFLYIIESDLERTYCGVTNDLSRRIHQHNGLIKGGAKATRGRNWEYFILITGFQNRNDLLSFEWRMHHPDGKKRKNKEFRGIEGRFKSIDVVLKWWREEKGHEEDLQIYLLPEYQEFVLTEWIEKRDLTSFLTEYSY